MSIFKPSPICRHFIGVIALVLAVATAHAQGNSQNNRKDAGNRAVQSFEFDESNSNFQTIERGANHQVLMKKETVKLEDGSEKEVVHSYTNLASGMHYWEEDTGSWKESRAVIEPHRGGAVAQFGQQKVIFANNLNTLGAVEILASDGVLLKASVLGVSYFDALSGDSVILAELKNSVGELVGDNQILYRNAFSGLKADVLYTYSIDGLEQDVILRENPPPPSEFGLPNLTSRLEVMTEWYDAPDPQKTSNVLSRKVEDPQLRDQMVEPDFVDEILSFGELKIGQGRAFWHHQNEGEADRFETHVGKKWETINGRTFLFESVEYESVETELKKLPPGRKKTALRSKQSGLTMVSLTDTRRRVPSRRFAEPTDTMIRPTKDGLSDDLGFVLDYTTVSGSFSDYTFEAGSTYYISGNTYFSNKLTIEGGTVVKLAPGSSYSIFVQGTVECKTSPYLPAIFTAKDDNQVGAFVSGSTGSPSGYYCYSPLRVTSGASAVALSHIKFRYTYYALMLENGQSSNSGKHLTFVKTDCPIRADAGSHVDLGNILMDDIGFCGFYTSGGGTVEVENASIHDALFLVFPDSNSLTLENSLIVDVSTIYNYTNRGQSHNIELSNYLDAFQTVGSGEFYLKENSIYRDFANHSAIDAGLESDFQLMTTHPPSQVYQWTTVSSDTTWSATTPRDSDEMDLGYHYPVVDVAVGGLQFSGDGSVLTVEPGAVVAWFTNVGLEPHPDVEIKMNGTPLDRVKIVCYRAVQEQPVNWAHYGPFYNDFLETYTFGYSGDNYNMLLEFRYCDFFDVNGYHANISAGCTYELDKQILIEFNRIYNGGIGICGLYGYQTIRNNIFYNSKLSFPSYGPVYLNARNNLFKYGTLYNQTVYGTCNFIDNVFDETDINNSQTTGLVQHHNAYINTNATLLPLNASDVVITGNYTWETGPMGDYYHPPGSALIDAGSQSAAASNLYHLTTMTNQVPDALSMVDLGYHYHIVDANGNLIDSDGDLILDILEDPDGDGIIDPGETDPFNSENGTTGVSGLQVFFPF